MTRQNALAVREEREQHPLVVGIQQRMAAPAFAKMLPAGMDFDRFAAVTIQAIVKNPDILNCTPESVIAAVVEAAQDGLEPTGARGGAHLVKFGTEAVLIRDYRGIIRIIIESGAATRVDARVVHRDDEFAIDYASPDPVTHRPAIPSKGEVLGYYALFWLPDGTKQAEFMSVADIEKVRAKSRGRDSMGWTEFFDQMARKTVIKRGANYLNLRPDIRERLMREDQAEHDGPIVSVQRDERIAASRQQIHERAARLTGGATEQPAAASTTPGAGPSNGGAAAGDTDCPHDPARHENVDAGVKCGDCGQLLAARAQERTASRGADPAPQVAASASASSPPGGSSSAPTTMAEAQSRVGALAIQHRLVTRIDSDEDWNRFDEVLRALDVPAPPLEASPEAIAEWNALGDRIARGDFDPPADADAVCPEHGSPWKWVPPGTKRDGSGQKYNGFFSCETRGCSKRPSDEWRRANRPADWKAA